MLWVFSASPDLKKLNTMWWWSYETRVQAILNDFKVQMINKSLQKKVNNKGILKNLYKKLLLQDTEKPSTF